MFNITQTRVVTMQYTIVVLLVIISLQAARAFKESAFRIIALVWLPNLAYLAASDFNRNLWTLLGIPPAHWGAPAQFFDFLTNTLFWYAAHRWGQIKNKLYLSNWRG